MEELNVIKTRQRGCETGSAVITGAGNLNAKYVIHAVGPIYRGGSGGEANLLASAYKTSLQLAEEHGAKTIAFPSISTGAYGYPISEAANIAIETVVAFCSDTPSKLETIRFVLFEHEAYAAFERALKRASTK